MIGVLSFLRGEADALERIGDHATNIAEDAFWQTQAEDIRHTFGAVREPD